MLVREDVPVPRHSGCCCRLDPPAPHCLERQVTIHRGRPLVLATQPEGLVARPEWRAQRGIVGIERQQRHPSRLELGCEYFGERVQGDEEDRPELLVRRDISGNEVRALVQDGPGDERNLGEISRSEEVRGDVREQAAWAVNDGNEVEEVGDDVYGGLPGGEERVRGGVAQALEGRAARHVRAHGDVRCERVPQEVTSGWVNRRQASGRSRLHDLP